MLEPCSWNERQKGPSPAAAALSCQIPLGGKAGLQAVDLWWFVKRGCSGSRAFGEGESMGSV